MKWLLIFLLCLSFVSADLLSIGTGENEISFSYGNFLDLFFSGSDVDVPVVTVLAPTSGLTATDYTQLYSYRVSSSNSISSCSLLMNGVVVLSDSTINSGDNSFTYTHSEGTHIWSVECTDEFSNTGTSENSSIVFYIAGRSGGSVPYDYYSECYGVMEGVCRYTVFYDDTCPDGYFLTLGSCIDFILLDEINQSTLDRLKKLADTLIYGDNKVETVKEITKTLNRIPSDINKYFSIIALKITPSNERLGKWIICIFLLLLLFSKEIKKMYKKIELKNEW